MDAEEADRVARGRATYARNLGMGEEEAEAQMSAVAGLTFTAEAYLAAGGPAWQSSALTDRDRSLAIIAALVGQHVTDDRLELYLAIARRNGVEDEGLEALMVLLASYLGQPATSRGAAAVRRTGPASVG
jgi:4-carboxymuconolactone decarboxylase